MTDLKNLETNEQDINDITSDLNSQTNDGARKYNKTTEDTFQITETM